jgi:hypothetical protein
MMMTTTWEVTPAAVSACHTTFSPKKEVYCVAERTDGPSRKRLHWQDPQTEPQSHSFPPFQTL